MLNKQKIRVRVLNSGVNVLEICCVNTIEIPNSWKFPGNLRVLGYTPKVKKLNKISLDPTVLLFHPLG